MAKLGSIFLRGLVTILPIGLTVWVLVWLGSSSEALFAGIYRQLLPESWYLPGMGLVTGFAAILAVGAFVQAWIVQQCLELLETLLLRVPLVKSVYSAIKDFMGYFSGSGGEKANQAVLVDLAPMDAKVVGLITAESLEVLSSGLGEEERVAVYMPMSYQLGGYTLLLRREQLTPLDMSFEEAMRFAVTAGVAKH